ncbi:MAG TPA: hypothetical protein VEH77_15830, partial [Roseiarcus sp.]|nr:hypothetical protein [Roseiarcus sp.]
CVGIIGCIGTHRVSIKIAEIDIRRSDPGADAIELGYADAGAPAEQQQERQEMRQRDATPAERDRP